MLSTALILSSGTAEAKNSEPIQPAMECEDLVSLNLRELEGAPSRIDSAEAVEIEGLGPHCVVRGYSASDVRFEVRLPRDTWTGLS